MQIHALEVQNDLSWELVDGRMKAVESRSLTPATVTSISHAGYDGPFVIDDDGSFEVPEDVAAGFVGKTLGGVMWAAGPNPFHKLAPPEDPASVPQRQTKRASTPRASRTRKG